MAALSGANAAMLARPDYVAALLSYHVLNGSYPASAFSNSSMFIPTLLMNETYANITGGQRVEARLSNGNVTFFSALKQNSTVVTGVGTILELHVEHCSNIYSRT